jgi:3-oxoacyl-[acyl-carrier protein] reductase
MFDLNNKKILITGGTGGIGKAMVNGFINLGSHVVYTSSSEEKIKLADFDKKIFDEQIISGEVCDMGDLVQVSEVAKKTLDIFDQDIDVLICNAGMNIDKLSLRMDISEWVKVINVNLNANFQLISKFLRTMVSKKKGSIILISSVVASAGNMGQANYCASKAGLEGMMKSIALEIARSNVRINAIAPGFIVTPMTDKIPDAIKEDLLKKIPMGRYGDTSDIFNMSAFLASQNLSKYITGQTFHVNGGMYFGG